MTYLEVIWLRLGYYLRGRGSSRSNNNPDISPPPLSNLLIMGEGRPVLGIKVLPSQASTKPLFYAERSALRAETYIRAKIKKKAYNTHNQRPMHTRGQGPNSQIRIPDLKVSNYWQVWGICVKGH